MKEIDAAQKALELHFGGWAGHGRDGLDLDGKRDNTGGIHKVPKVFNLGSSKNTFFAVNAKAGGAQSVQDPAEIFHVLGHRAAGDKDVVQVHKDPVQIAQDPVHETLECLGGILEPEGHP